MNTQQIVGVYFADEKGSGSIVSTLYLMPHPRKPFVGISPNVTAELRDMGITLRNGATIKCDIQEISAGIYELQRVSDIKWVNNLLVRPSDASFSPPLSVLPRITDLEVNQPNVHIPFSSSPFCSNELAMATWLSPLGLGMGINVVGPGGVGKTRLLRNALSVFCRLGNNYISIETKVGERRVEVIPHLSADRHSRLYVSAAPINVDPIDRVEFVRRSVEVVNRWVEAGFNVFWAIDLYRYIIAEDFVLKGGEAVAGGLLKQAYPPGEKLFAAYGRYGKVGTFSDEWEADNGSLTIAAVLHNGAEDRSANYVVQKAIRNGTADWFLDPEYAAMKVYPPLTYTGSRERGIPPSMSRDIDLFLSPEELRAHLSLKERYLQEEKAFVSGRMPIDKHPTRVLMQKLGMIRGTGPNFKPLNIAQISQL